MPSLRNAASDTRLRPSFLGLAFAGKSTTLKSECVNPVVVSLPLFPFVHVSPGTDRHCPRLI